VRQDYEKYRAGLQDRLGDIEGQLRATSKESDETRDHLKRLSDNLKALDAQAQELQTTISAIRDRGASWISFRIALHHANWVLTTYLILVPLYGFAIVLLGLRIRWLALRIRY